MGCMQSEPYMPDGAPIEAIAFRRKSGKNKRSGSKKDHISGHQVPTPATAGMSTMDAPRESPGSITPRISPSKSPGNIFNGRERQSNELTMSVDALEAVDLEIKEKRMLQKRGVFPVWKKHDKCTFCVTGSSIHKEEDKADEKELVLKVTNIDPMDPRLCGQYSNTALTNVQNNMRSTQHQGVNVAIANLLAVTALDLTAPASDALLKNRKNAWIQVAGHPGSFAPAGPNTIWKKRMEKENYETKAYQALMGEELKDVVPKFYREVEYNGEYFIEMEDLLQHFQDPNIMDIKMGKRTFLELEVKNPVLRKDLYEKMVSIDQDAPLEDEKNREAITKLRYMQFREKESSTAELGFRIEAIRMSGEPPNMNLKKTKQKEQTGSSLYHVPHLVPLWHDKEGGLQLLAGSLMVAEVILNFYKGQMTPLQSLLTRLIEIREKFENSTFFKGHEIIGSSLLIMYDAENCGAWMIDFAKTIPVDSGLTLDHRSHWKIGTHEDGYLSGLDNLVQIVEYILDGEMGHEEAVKDNS